MTRIKLINESDEDFEFIVNFPPRGKVACIYTDRWDDPIGGWEVDCDALKKSLENYDLGFRVAWICNRLKAKIPYTILEGRGMARKMTRDECVESMRGEKA